MNAIYLEHVNVSVRNPKSLAKELCQIFDWTIRWSGSSMDNGLTVHVGNEASTSKKPSTYLALYTNPEIDDSRKTDHSQLANLNHIAVVVDDLDAVEQRVRDSGYDTLNHADYEPGRRFYFNLPGEIEIEVVSYSS